MKEGKKKELITIEISGKIQYEEGDFKRIRLIQSDGLRLDLISRMEEIQNSFSNFVSLQYWTSKIKLMRDECVEAELKKLYGDLQAEYETEIQGGCPTCGSWTENNSILEIGGHDLFRELREQDGKFLLIEITVEK